MIFCLTIISAVALHRFIMDNCPALNGVEDMKDDWYDLMLFWFTIGGGVKVKSYGDALTVGWLLGDYWILPSTSSEPQSRVGTIAPDKVISERITGLRNDEGMESNIDEHFTPSLSSLHRIPSKIKLQLLTAMDRANGEGSFMPSLLLGTLNWGWWSWPSKILNYNCRQTQCSTISYKLISSFEGEVQVNVLVCSES